MKNILLLLGLVIGLAAQAATVTKTYVNDAGFGATNVIFTAPARIDSIVIQNNDTTNSTGVQFIDAWTNKLAYTNSTYTNYTVVSKQLSSYIWTNSAGVPQTNDYATNIYGVFWLTNQVAATGANYRTILNTPVPGSSSLVFSNLGTVNYGLVLATNKLASVTVTVTYSSFK